MNKLFVTGQRLLVLMLIIGLATVVYIYQQLPLRPFLNQNRIEFGSEKVEKVMCLGESVVLEVPDADGYVIRPYLPANQWPLFYSANETDRRIFFHETGGSGHIDLFQCCAVESAAFRHPDRPVRLFIRPSTDCSDDIKLRHSFSNQPCFKVLDRHPNAVAILLNEDNYVAGSAFENWYRNGEWRRSPYEKAHLADYFRILTMSKGGGLYLDVDVITRKSYDGKAFENFFVYGDDFTDQMSNTVLHLERDHWLIEEIVQEMAEDYNPDDYLYHGPEVIGHVMHRICSTLSHHPKLEKCRQTIKVLPAHVFYPIPAMFIQLLFDDYKTNDLDSRFPQLNGSFALHLWSSAIGDLKASIDFNSDKQYVAQLFRQNCPETLSWLAQSHRLF